MKTPKRIANDVSERARELAADIPERAKELFVLVGFIRAVEAGGIDTGNAIDGAVGELCDLAERHVRGASN